MKINSDYIIIFALLILGLLTRTVFHIAPNIEFVTAAGIAGGFFLKNKKLALLIPLSVMIVSDSILGNTSIFLFTWSAFLFAPALGALLSNKRFEKFFDNNMVKKTLIVGGLGSLLSVIMFFLWTNFGVVITSQMYPDTLQGLMRSYVNALPFLRNQFYGNMVIGPAVFMATYLLQQLLNLEYTQKLLHAKS